MLFRQPTRRRRISMGPVPFRLDDGKSGLRRQRQFLVYLPNLVTSIRGTDLPKNPKRKPLDELNAASRHTGTTARSATAFGSVNGTPARFRASISCVCAV